MDGLAWPENYTKGDKPIETETGTTHDMDRCKTIQKQHTGVKKPGWIDRACDECKVVTKYNRKNYTERTIPRVCRDCNFEKFNNLSDYGISL